MKALVALAIATCMFLLDGVAVTSQVFAEEDNRYVGSSACQDCHEHEYGNFVRYAKKAKEPNSVKIMMSDLDAEEVAECYACHTTGYGKPGGFVSYEQTPGLGHAGCEVCHGPGHLHLESGGDPAFIKGKPVLKDCEGCHNSERVNAFNYKPLLHGGAH